jgi:hypothetical protein
MPATFAGPCPEVLDFLASLPPGSVVAQLDDGSITVCHDLEEADRQIVESQVQSARQNKRQCRVASGR